VRLLLAALLVCLAIALPADAQIYTWRDASGHLVLSNRPRPGGAGEDVTTYAVPARGPEAPARAAGPPSLRTTTNPVRSRSGERYDDLIDDAAIRYRVSPDLVRAVIQAESGFNPLAVSPKGAMGLMQLMPATARELGVSDPFHPAENIRGGVTYLARLLARYGDNVELALAAYNAGPGAVERYGAVPPFRETQQYVKKITYATQSASPAPPAPPVMYKWTEIADDKTVVRYSNILPKGVSYEIVGRR
jgi:soluble lytic murein transglycosylase-like protein